MKTNPGKIVLIISPDSSDVYFANRLIREFNVDAVIVEQKPRVNVRRKVKKFFSLLTDPTKITAEISDRKIWKDHYKKTKPIIRKFFGRDANFLQLDNGCKIIYATPGKGINHPEYVKVIKDLDPDIIALCGCSIIKKPILEIPQKGILNLHGGLSQKYRGVWTTLWAVHNNEPEYVGATVHFVSPGVDDGDIVYQARPEIIHDDNHESLYCKVVEIGIEMMCQALRDVASGEVRRHRLTTRGHLYRSKMVTAETVRKAWANIENGIIEDYLAHKQERDMKVVSMLQGGFQGARSQ